MDIRKEVQPYPEKLLHEAFKDGQWTWYGMADLFVKQFPRNEIRDFIMLLDTLTMKSREGFKWTR